MESWNLLRKKKLTGKNLLNWSVMHKNVCKFCLHCGRGMPLLDVTLSPSASQIWRKYIYFCLILNCLCSWLKTSLGFLWVFNHTMSSWEFFVPSMILAISFWNNLLVLWLLYSSLMKQYLQKDGLKVRRQEVS